MSNMRPAKTTSEQDPQNHGIYTMRNIAVTVFLALLAFLAQRVWPWDQDHTASIVYELGPKLSPNATILLPKDSDFAGVTMRWVDYQAPTFRAAVVVACEEDVQQSVLYANKHNIPFLATTGKHGEMSSLQEMQKGLQIDMRALNKIEIPPTGDHATVGGGTLIKQFTNTLAAAGKRAATGICECTSISGPMLGGGLGFLQGQYGLMIDQVIDVSVVLANGSTAVVSADSNPDLFWALRGAGHNFGIVTQLNYKIYDMKGHENWSYEVFTFTGDRLEECLTAINTIAESQPAEAAHFGFLAKVLEVDPVNPIFAWTVLYDGVQSDLKKHTALLHALKPLQVQSGRTPYVDTPVFLQSSNNDVGCQPGVRTWLRFPTGLKQYNAPAMRRVYDAFSKKMQESPAFNNSLYVLESYSMPAVRTVSHDSTAYAHRDYQILASPLLNYEPDPALDAEAAEFGEKVRQMVLEGTDSPELHAYINYAHGSESLEAIYGHEPWRLEKLRALKAEYDPEGKFGYYAPIH